MTNKYQSHLVSVILPNYNYGRFLEKRIRSIQNQGYQNIEIVFIDDASLDNSVDTFYQVCRPDLIKKVIKNEINIRKPLLNWITALQYCSGEYVWIAEADDYCEDNFLENLVGVLKNNPAMTFAYCGSVRVDESGRKLDVTWKNEKYVPYIEENNISIEGDHFIKRHLASCNVIPNMSAALFRASFLNVMADIKSLDLTLTADWVLYFKLCQRGNVGLISANLNYFRTHSHSIRSSSRLEGIKDKFKTMRYFYSEMPDLVFDQNIVNGLVLDGIIYCCNYSKSKSSTEFVKGMIKFYFEFKRYHDHLFWAIVKIVFKRVFNMKKS